MPVTSSIPKNGGNYPYKFAVTSTEVGPAILFRLRTTPREEAIVGTSSIEYKINCRLEAIVTTIPISEISTYNIVLDDPRISYISNGEEKTVILNDIRYNFTPSSGICDNQSTQWTTVWEDVVFKETLYSTSSDVTVSNIELKEFNSSITYAGIYTGSISSNIIKASSDENNNGIIEQQSYVFSHPLDATVKFKSLSNNLKTPENVVLPRGTTYTLPTVENAQTSVQVPITVKYNWVVNNSTRGELLSTVKINDAFKYFTYSISKWKVTVDRTGATYEYNPSDTITVNEDITVEGIVETTTSANNYNYILPSSYYFKNMPGYNLGAYKWYYQAGNNPSTSDKQYDQNSVYTIASSTIINNESGFTLVFYTIYKPNSYRVLVILQPMYINNRNINIVALQNLCRTAIPLGEINQIEIDWTIEYNSSLNSLVRDAILYVYRRRNQQIVRIGPIPFNPQTDTNAKNLFITPAFTGLYLGDTLVYNSAWSARPSNIFSRSYNNYICTYTNDNLSQIILTPNFSANTPRNIYCFGEKSATQEVVSFQCENSTTIPINIPEDVLKTIINYKPGYKFEGLWTKDSNIIAEGTKIYDENGHKLPSVMTTTTSDINLCARWSAGKYVVLFDCNGGHKLGDVWSSDGDGVIRGAINEDDSSFVRTFITNTNAYSQFYYPKREGYIFEGWYLTDYQPGGDWNNGDPGFNLTEYCEKVFELETVTGSKPVYGSSLWDSNGKFIGTNAAKISVRRFDKINKTYSNIDVNYVCKAKWSKDHNIKVKINNVWKTVTNVWVKIGGKWKSITNLFIKSNNDWHFENSHIDEAKLGYVNNIPFDTNGGLLNITDTSPMTPGAIVSGNTNTRSILMFYGFNAASGTAYGTNRMQNEDFELIRNTITTSAYGGADKLSPTSVYLYIKKGAPVPTMPGKTFAGWYYVPVNPNTPGSLPTGWDSDENNKYFDNNGILVKPWKIKNDKSFYIPFDKVDASTCTIEEIWSWMKSNKEGLNTLDNSGKFVAKWL